MVNSKLQDTQLRVSFLHIIPPAGIENRFQKIRLTACCIVLADTLTSVWVSTADH